MKAYLIARVSSEDQKDALPAQVYKMEDYAKRLKVDYEVKQFQESAYQGERVIFKEIIEEIKASNELVYVIFDKIDRLTRDVSSEEVRTLRTLAFEGSIELHFCSDNLIIKKDSTALDRFNLGMGSVFAEHTSATISYNVRRRNEQLWRDGFYTGKAPFGYINTVDQNNRKWISRDPLKAEAVKNIFKWYSTDSHTLRTIRLKMIDEYAVKFSSSQIAAILRNPFYMGEMLIKGKLYKHNYETLIRKDTYTLTKEIREGRKATPKRWAGLPFAYRGLINCAECGSKITFEKQKQKYIYGHCTQFKGRHGAAYVREEKLTEQLKTVFDNIALPEEAYEEISKQMRQRREKRNTDRVETIRVLEIEIQKYQGRIDRLYEDLVDGNITKDFYDRKNKDYSRAKGILEKRRNNIELSDSTQYGSTSHLLKLAKNAPEIFKRSNIEQTRSLVNFTLSNLRLEGDQLRWELKKPYDIMASCNEKRDWQGYVESNHDLGFWRPTY